MLIIRPTASLAKRMRIKLPAPGGTSTTKLGDWYALDFVVNKKQFILCVSSTTRLATVLAAAPYATFPERLPVAIMELLQAIGVPDSQRAVEMSAMSEITLEKTASRSILGTLNDFRMQLEYYAVDYALERQDPLAMTLHLSETISLVLPEGYPKDAAMKALALSLTVPRKMSPLDS